MPPKCNNPMCDNPVVDNMSRCAPCLKTLFAEIDRESVRGIRRDMEDSGIPIRESWEPEGFQIVRRGER